MFYFLLHFSLKTTPVINMDMLDRRLSCISFFFLSVLSLYFCFISFTLSSYPRPLSSKLRSILHSPPQYSTPPNDALRKLTFSDERFKLLFSSFFFSFVPPLLSYFCIFFLYWERFWCSNWATAWTVLASSRGRCKNYYLFSSHCQGLLWNSPVSPSSWRRALFLRR